MQENVYCAEAQFLPRPKRYASEILEEDDGVIISSLIKGIAYFSDLNHNLEQGFEYYNKTFERRPHICF